MILQRANSGQSKSEIVLLFFFCGKRGGRVGGSEGCLLNRQVQKHSVPITRQVSDIARLRQYCGYLPRRFNSPESDQTLAGALQSFGDQLCSLGLAFSSDDGGLLL